jgi:hypothetical protein
MSFMEEVLKPKGKSDIYSDDIDKFVAEWHKSKSDLALSEYLGMKPEEYVMWAEQPHVLPAIIIARQKSNFLCTKNHLWNPTIGRRVHHFESVLQQIKEDWEYGEQYGVYKCKNCGYTFEDVLVPDDAHF